MNRLSLMLLLCFSGMVAGAEPMPEPAALPETGVTLKTDDAELKKLFDDAEARSQKNERTWGSYRVLVEGGYPWVYLETQPMGGAMWVKRSVAAARNNILIFTDQQFEDGKIPRIVSGADEQGNANPSSKPLPKVTPRRDQSLQGYCFPQPALDVYYWLKKDKSFARRVYEAMVRFDNWLWAKRDTNRNGYLETVSDNDTGEDLALRFKVDRPFESMDMMAYSFDQRKVLSALARELDLPAEADEWSRKAAEVREKVRKYHWRPEMAACYDRKRGGEFTKTLVHNNLRGMYHGVFDQEMADAFVRRHLVNTEEFWTPVPLPSVAYNDPLFRNIPGNNWSGQPESLTYQRSIRSLENYGHYALVTMLGRRFMETVQQNGTRQQYDPVTGQTNSSAGGSYGPALLSVLEYISRMYGVEMHRGQLWFSGLQRGAAALEYTQTWGETTFTTHITKDRFVGLIGGREVFSATPGVRIVTDLQGRLLSVVGIDVIDHDVTVRSNGRMQTIRVRPNEVYTPNETGSWTLVPSAPFYFPDRPTIAPQMGRYVTESMPLPVRIRYDFPDAKICYTTDGSEPVEQSKVYDDSLTLKEACLLKARAFRPGQPPGETASVRILAPLPAVNAGPLVQGLRFGIFRGRTEGDTESLREYFSGKPQEEGVIARPGMPEGMQKNEDFGMRFAGYIQVPKTGKYAFVVRAPGGAALRIDGQPVNIYAAHRSAYIGLSGGLHAFELDCRLRGEGILNIKWTGSEFPLQDIPATAFFRDAGASKSIAPRDGPAKPRRQ